jgi:HAMP domain-containing protein
VPTLAALTAGAAVALPYELAGGQYGLALGGVAALAVGLGVTWTTARRWEGRLVRILRFAEQLETGASMPFLAAERRDLVGEAEEALGRMARGVSGRSRR